MLDVRRLRVLREVALCGSFSAAAEALSYSQSAVSQQVAALERETGTTLLQRGSGGVRLTDAGQALVARADVILAQLADEAWVGGCGGGVCHAMVMDWCADAGFEPNIAFESDDHNVLIGLVAAGVGVALLPQLAMRMGHPGAESRPVAGRDLVRKIYA